MTLGALSPRAKLDLHIHTSLSDGAYSPDTTIELAAKGGLDVVALTDHDLVAPVQHGHAW